MTTFIQTILYAISIAIMALTLKVTVELNNRQVQISLHSYKEFVHALSFVALTLTFDDREGYNDSIINYSMCQYHQTCRP